MYVVRKSEAVARNLDGEIRTQYFGPQIRIGITTMPPHRKQRLHSHESVTESIYVLSGDIQAYEHDEGQLRETKLHEGDFVTFVPGPAHTLGNASDAEAKVVVVKAAFDPRLDAEAFRQLCMSDWIEFSWPGWDDASARV